MRGTFLVAGLAAALAMTGAAKAYFLMPDEPPGTFFVVIEGDLGDHVPLAALPPPYDRLGHAGWLVDGVRFRWRYFRSSEQGGARLLFEQDGRATMIFDFAGEELADGDTIAASAVLTGPDREALHTIHAKAKVRDGAFANGGSFHSLGAEIDLPRETWDAVTGFTFFNMKYYRIQNLDDEGVAEAMRRAVHRVTGGKGGEQWAREGSFVD